MVTCSLALVYSLVNFLCSLYNKTITNNQATLDLKLSIEGFLEKCGGTQFFDETLKKYTRKKMSIEALLEKCGGTKFLDERLTKIASVDVKVIATCLPLVYSLVNFLCCLHDITETKNQVTLDLKLSIEKLFEKCGGIQFLHQTLTNCAASSSHSQNRPKWKPVPTDSWLLQVQPNQPWRSYKTQLYSRTRYNLAVYPDGTVNGTRDDNDLHTHLELLSGGGTGLVKIKGLLSNMFVGMNRRGKLYAEPDPTSTNIVFVEEFQGDYTTYKSKKFEHRNWYIGIKKNGRFKRGPRTKIGQKAISFLPRNRKQ